MQLVIIGYLEMCIITACSLNTYSFQLNEHKKHQQKSNIQRKLHFKSEKDHSNTLRVQKLYEVFKIEAIAG